MGQLMETIQVLARVQKAMARVEEELRQATLRVASTDPPLPPPMVPTV